MDPKLQENIKATVAVDGEVIINPENSEVYLENWILEDMTIIVKSKDGKEIKVHFEK